MGQDLGLILSQTRDCKTVERPLCATSGRQARLGEAFICNICRGLIRKIFEIFRQLFCLG